MIEKTKKNLRIYIICYMAALLILIFGGIISIFYVSMYKSEVKALDDILTFQFPSNINQEDFNDKGISEHEGELAITPPESRPNANIFEFIKRDEGPNKQAFYYFIIDDDDNIIAYRSFDFREQESEEALNGFIPYMTDSSGVVSIDESTYHYKTASIEGYTAYAVLDVTISRIILENIILIAIFVFILSLIFISIFTFKLTNKTLYPLKQSIENQKRFSSDASHELRTPLASIRSNLDILQQYDEDLTSEERSVWISNISKEIDRMTKLTSDLLAVSRESDNMDTDEFMDFSTTELIESIQFTYNPICEENNIVINYEYEEFDIFGKEMDFKQLIIILIDNAIKYNDKEEKIIDLSLKKKEKYFQICIRDNGIGIKEEDFDKIFERFYRDDEARSNNNGFGLGLSIGNNIIKKYNGTVKIKSTKNEFTEFKINFVKKDIH